MNEADFIVKILPRWLEIDKSSPNKPAVILSQKFGLSRNIKKYPFLKNATALEKDAIFADIMSVFEKNKYFTDKKFLKINLLRSNYLIEGLLFEKDIVPLQMMSRDWARGVFMSYADKDFPVFLINAKNHLDIISGAPFGKEAEALAKLNEIDNILGEELLYAYDSRMGFLASNPEECGSGLYTETIAHLPGIVLTEEINEVLNGLSVMGARAEGIQNDNLQAWGAFFRITANFSDANEDELVRRTQEIQHALTVAESKARKRLFKEARMVMEDKVFRSFAMMKYARIMTASQLFNFVSLLRLGSEQRIFPMNMKVINMLFERGWTANMLLMSNIAEITDLDEERAKMYRSILKDINIL